MTTETTAPALPLEAVLTTAELSRRPGRPADLVAENRALLALAQYLAEKPAEILQKLCETAIALCGAGSSGVSLIEEENDVFRWHAVAGELAALRWATLPRFFSPCGIVVDSSAPQLMSYPEKHFPYIADIKPTVVEVLLIPFAVNEKTVGTVWIVSHDPDHQFDTEDVRIITQLTAFAAAGFKTQKIQKDLETAIRNRDEFLAVLGHEMRNPLSPLATAHKLLSAPQLDEKTRSASLEVIGRQLTHMQRLVDDILDVSRIAEGKLAVTKKPVEIGALIDEAIESAKTKANQSQLSLKASLPEEPVYVNADAGRIIQIVNNLLNNAIKFTPPDGSVFVNVQLNGDHVCISIRDTGIGLAPENRSAIFSMFVQLEGTPKNNKGGLGVGLGLAKTLTELHDGTISVRSEGLNQGCEFVIKLPVLAEFSKTTVKREVAEHSAAPLQALRILVADDNEDSADSLATLLRMKGYAVWVAYDGLDSVSHACSWRPHVALLDLSLPGLNGYEVVERLRQNSATRHCLLVAVTGHATEADRARTKACGFDAHIVKPVDLNELYELLESTVIYEGAERRVADHPFFNSERRRIRAKNSA